MGQTPETPDQTSTLQHAFRISLNQTRRVVRRVIEIDIAAQSAQHVHVPNYPAFLLNKEAEFLLTVRMLRRVVRHLINQAANTQTNAFGLVASA